jgi:hypothetical protein
MQDMYSPQMCGWRKTTTLQQSRTEASCMQAAFATFMAITA